MNKRIEEKAIVKTLKKLIPEHSERADPKLYRSEHWHVPHQGGKGCRVHLLTDDQHSSSKRRTELTILASTA